MRKMKKKTREKERNESKTIRAMVEEFGCLHVLIEFFTLTKMNTRTHMPKA